jgi:hypothetical protein
VILAAALLAAALTVAGLALWWRAGGSWWP